MRLTFVYFDYSALGYHTILCRVVLCYAIPVPQALTAFRMDPEVKVLLISLKAGGVALNLTVASRIFLMGEPARMQTKNNLT